jgi:hypothetical protein
MTIVALDEIERAVTLLNAKRAKIEQRVAATTATRQQLAYDALVLGDREARARLAEVHAELGKVTHEASDLDVARTEANHRLAVAQRAAKRAADAERVKRVEVLLTEIKALGPVLDAHTGTMSTGATPMADAERFRYLRNPGAQVKAAALVGATLAELHQLGIARDVTFPNRLWDAANRTDLLKVLLDTMTTGWRYRVQGLSYVERNSFVALLAAWSKWLRDDLQQQQTNNKESEAA